MQPILQRRYSGNNGLSIIKVGSEGYIIAGEKYSTATDYDYYLVGVTPDGDIIWEKTFGGSDEDRLSLAIPTFSNECLLVGCTSIGAGYNDIYIVLVDFMGGLLWENVYRRPGWPSIGHTAIQTSDGGFLIVGETWPSTSGYSKNLYLLKLDYMGNVQWEKIHANKIANDVIALTNGDYVVAGTDASLDFYLARLDAMGNIIWEKSYGGPEREEAYALCQTSDGGYIIVGEVDLSGNRDIYVVKVNANGNLMWEMTLGRSYWDEGFDVVEDYDEGYIVVGMIDYDSINMTGKVYVAKLSVNGALEEEVEFGGTYASEGHAVLLGDFGELIIAGTYSETPYISETCLWKIIFDKDFDRLSDSFEWMIGTNPLDPDTDGDSLIDSDELIKGTDPLNMDTDGDFWNDSLDLFPTMFLLPNAVFVLLALFIAMVAYGVKSRKKI